MSKQVFYLRCVMEEVDNPQYVFLLQYFFVACEIRLLAHGHIVAGVSYSRALCWHFALVGSTLKAIFYSPGRPVEQIALSYSHMCCVASILAC